VEIPAVSTEDNENDHENNEFPSTSRDMAKSCSKDDEIVKNRRNPPEIFEGYESEDEIPKKKMTEKQPKSKKGTIFYLSL
jgi:hypothetical protein